MKTIPLDSYAYSLARLRWDVFGTLTFRSVPSPKRAYGRAWALMRRAAELVQRPYSQLLIALRAELGELTGRFHFPFLLGGTQTRNEITLVYQLKHLWYGLFGQGSTSKWRRPKRKREHKKRRQHEWRYSLFHARNRNETPNCSQESRLSESHHIFARE